MASEAYENTLDILFFPLMAPGHMLPLLDMAKLFAGRGVNATFLTTPANAPLIQPSIDRHPVIKLHLIAFPLDSGLPAGCENLSTVPDQHLEPNFYAALGKLRQPFHQLLADLRPDCVITDWFLPWTHHVAAELGIPRLVFHGTNFFSQCAFDSIGRHKVFESLPVEAESFVLPGLPHRIEIPTSSMPDLRKMYPVFLELFPRMMETNPKSYGVVVNSFYELEPDYANHYMGLVGMKSWSVGPVSLHKKERADKSNNAACLNWLDSKTPGSVVYVSFGSLCHFSNTQLREIALGLEASNQPFIWVVREGDDEWMIDGYEARIEGKGLIIRGWAPQIPILNHEAVGGFVTHCGWNSTLEGICAALPLVTWPIFAEQFFNEKLIVDVLEIGISVGAKEYTVMHAERPVVESGKVERALSLLMDDGVEAVARRGRLTELGKMAKKAVEIGGSSYNDMDSLIKELKECKKTK